MTHFVAMQLHSIVYVQGRTSAGMWIALSEHSPFQHDYVIVRRTTQHVPWFAEPIPRGSRRGAVAQRLLIYFRPWVSACLDQFSSYYAQ